MYVFKDRISGDEIVSDSFNMKEVDNIVYEVDCAMITLGAVQVDTGANASAEEAEEGVEDTEEKVNNIVHSFRLQPTSFDKKGYMSYLKGYMKSVKAKLVEANEKATKEEDKVDVAAFEKGAGAYFKNTILPNFKDYEFFTGESMDVDGIIVLLNYREDGVTPFITVWKHGVWGEKI